MMAIVVGLSLIMKGNKKGSTTFIFFSAIAMFVVMGLREATLIGIDSASSYLHDFQDITAMDWESFKATYVGFNAGFFYLMKIVSQLSHGNYQVFIIVISAFIIICLAHFVNRHSVSPIQSFCYYWGLLYYIFMFSTEKQAVAMAFLLLAFDAVMDERPLKFILLVAIATQFHFPSLVFLPAYLIAKMKIERYYIPVLIAALIVTYIFRDDILRLMLMTYGGDEIEASMEGIALLRTKSIIMIGIVIAAILLRVPNEEDRLYSILLKFMGVAIIFQMFCGYNNIFERLADYYFQFSIVFIPLVFERGEDIQFKINAKAANFIKLVSPLIFSGYGIFRFAMYIESQVGVFLPYVFCFE